MRVPKYCPVLLSRKPTSVNLRSVQTPAPPHPSPLSAAARTYPRTAERCEVPMPRAQRSVAKYTPAELGDVHPFGAVRVRTARSAAKPGRPHGST